MKTIVVPVSDRLKEKLDALRARGYTINGYVRAVLERELADKPLPTARGRDRLGQRDSRGIGRTG